MDFFTVVKEMLVRYFEVPPESITPEATRDDTDLDSLVMVQLSILLEREAGVTVTHDDLHATETIGEMVDLITKRASAV